MSEACEKCGADISFQGENHANCEEVVSLRADLEEALELLEMCATCDLVYSVTHATGIAVNGRDDPRRVSDLVGAFLEKHSRNA